MEPKTAMVAVKLPVAGGLVLLRYGGDQPRMRARLEALGPSIASDPVPGADAAPEERVEHTRRQMARMLYLTIESWTMKAADGSEAPMSVELLLRFHGADLAAMFRSAMEHLPQAHREDA